MHAFPNISNVTPHRPTARSQIAAQHQPQYPVGRPSNASDADSGLGLLANEDQRVAREKCLSEKKVLYEDLQDLIDRKRRGWVVTRDAELAYPLQQRFLVFEAEVMADIHELERERESKYRQREREMRGATGIARMSWKLYKLKMKLCGKWRKHRLHNSWKHGRLSAQKRKLSEEYVQTQIGRRLNVVKEVMWFANEEGVEDGDDGGYVRDGILNYIVTGYESMFPISRDLEVDITRI